MECSDFSGDACPAAAQWLVVVCVCMLLPFVNDSEWDAGTVCSSA